MTACSKDKPAPRVPATDAAAHEADEAARTFEYPETRRLDLVETLHGVDVADPYRWLEDLDSEETRAWIEAQNELTFGYLEKIPARNAIRARLTELWDYERYGLPTRRGGRYFYSKNDGLQNQSVLYVTSDLDEEGRVLLDPNKLSEDGTVALSGIAISEDGRYLAYGVSKAGSDWQEWFVRDVETGKDLDDHLRWIKFSGASWTKDGKGFFYSRYDAPKEGENEYAGVNYYQKLYYHRVGTPQAEDELVYERKDHKEWGFDGEVTEDGKYVIIHVRVGTDPKNGIFYRRLRPSKSRLGGGRVVELLRDFDAEYVFVGNDGPVFWFRTDKDAPRGKVIAVDTRRPEPSNWKVVVPETDATLESVSVVGNRFFAKYLRDAKSQVEVYTLSGKHERTVELPGMGTVYGFGGRRKDKETFYGFTSFTMPATIYRYDIGSGRSEVWRKPPLKFDPADFVTEQVFYRSKDGTKVPMFVSRRKDVTPNGERPTYLYGYGGFNIPITPSFSVPNLVWMEMGGVYAVANLRGGGEYGETWHQAGTKHRKQNVFDDFAWAAKWLIEQGWTKPSRLAIGGRSNGGLLAGASIVQHPELFGAALVGVGVLDMLRFHKFTIGWAWVSDYGSPDDPEDFKALLAYSPYHNVRDGVAYPATLIYTADHDDRVVPAHSYKFAAALQHAQAGPAPILIRIDTKAGHGAGKPTTKMIEEWTDLWAFLVDNLHMELSPSFGGAQATQK
ncbi:MAG: S9 family peptidase [Deltaproteobacteria bacterium]|nr:MAG: S9 family peptidase [Deltaproteobacteria bacterium]